MLNNQKSSLLLQRLQKNYKYSLPPINLNNMTHISPIKSHKHVHSRNLNNPFLKLMPIEVQNNFLSYYQSTDIFKNINSTNSTKFSNHREVNLSTLNHNNRILSPYVYLFDTYNITSSNAKDKEKILKLERHIQTEKAKYLKEFILKTNTNINPNKILYRSNKKMIRRINIDKNNIRNTINSKNKINNKPQEYIKNIKFIPKAINVGNFHRNLMLNTRLYLEGKEKNDAINKSALTYNHNNINNNNYNKCDDEEKKTKNEKEEYEKEKKKFNNKEMSVIDYLIFNKKEEDFNKEYQKLTSNKKIEKEIIRHELNKIRVKRGLIKPIDLHKIYNKPLFLSNFLKYSHIKKTNPVFEINKTGTTLGIVNDHNLMKEMFEECVNQCENFVKS